ncbi:MAG: restriction endonuclease [Algicola sp.]|nr:restriction endonuclease [Algicola sp.]
MPARTNEFQKLVKVINHSLAPSNAKITESAMLYDPESEIDREIDILIESNLLNCNIKIGVECTAVARPLDVRAIESFREKHRKVGINQIIVVSEKGFSSAAKKYAKKSHIRLLTFNSAKSENWSKKFEKLKNLSMYARNYSLRNLYVALPDDADKEFVFDNLVRIQVKGHYVAIHEFARDIFVSANVGKLAAGELKANEKGAEDPWIEVGFELKGDYIFRDKNDREVRPIQITVVMNYKSNYRDLNTRQVEYDGNELVIGSSLDEDNNNLVSIAINESENNLVASLEINPKLFPAVK